MTIGVKVPMQGIVPGNKVIYGGFLCNGSSDPATTYGRGFTVARTATGVWTVTITEPMSSFVCVLATLNMPDSATTTHEIRIGDKSAANGTFQITNQSTADSSTTDFALADVAAATDQAVYFLCIVSESGLVGSA